MGGSTEDSGIMDGMRSRFENGGSAEEAMAELDRRAPSPNFGRSAFLRDFGLNLLACFSSFPKSFHISISSSISSGVPYPVAPKYSLTICD